MTTKIRIPQAESPFEIVWDKTGIPHVYADSIADAYRGMGYAAGRERLWQIHLSTAYANCEAAALLGERFLNQDAIQRACNVHGQHTRRPDSEGDWIATAYLEGLNAVVDELDAPPPEFIHAGATPRHFTLDDIAARYRFTSWFQHKSWTEKLAIGRLMAKFGPDYFRHHLLHFSNADEEVISALQTPLSEISVAPFVLAYPEAAHVVLSGSNNWSVTGALSKSGKPILATDPHQPHSIPNTFFYVHLHAPGWDVFGAAFPGVPYFMMGTTQNIAWGLTTGMIDCYDAYIERTQEQTYLSDDAWRDIEFQQETIGIKGGEDRTIEIARTHHGTLIERLCDQLGIEAAQPSGHETALYWSFADTPTSAGALARLPLASNSEEFGHFLFEDDVCPLVNNIICTDKDNGLRRFIATTTPAREGVTGSVPLPGWDSRYDFPLSTETAMTVEIDPARQYTLTANNDTMGETGPYYVHTFPANSARADRIVQILEDGDTFDVEDFKEAQLDLLDLRAAEVLPDLLNVLSESDDKDVQLAYKLLSEWDQHSSPDATGACLFYPFLDRIWARKFMRSVFSDPAIDAIPTAAPALNLFDIGHFLAPDNPWAEHREQLINTVCDTMASVVNSVKETLGSNPENWQWGQLHQIHFAHRLSKQAAWANMEVGPDPIGGSATSLAMAMHMGPGPGRAKVGEIPCRVYHGPAFRLVVDLADPDHVHFVIAGGNGGQAGSKFATNQYPAWLNGEFYVVSYLRDELEIEEAWQIEP